MSRRATAPLSSGSAVATVAILGFAFCAIGARATIQAQGTASVAVIDDRFRPTQLTVDVGTTVVWTNQGQHPHTVTANDRAFDSGTLEGGQSFSVTFDESGSVAYYCQIHGEPGSGMTGVVIVRAAPDEESGEASTAPGSDVLARTGLDPRLLGIGSIALAIAGLVALRLRARSIGGRR